MNITIAHFGTYYVGMSGGVEKVTCQFANAMIKRGHHVTILYRDSREGSPYFYLDPNVKQHNILFEKGKQIISDKLPFPLRICREIARLFSQKSAQAINARYKGMQYGKSIKKYLDSHPTDIIISCSAPSTKYTITDAHCQIPVIQMIHADPEIQFPDFSAAEKNAISQCKAMQILTSKGLSFAQAMFPSLPITVIGNPIEPAPEIKTTYEEQIICSVGNLCPRKNQEFLVKAFETLHSEFPDWTLELWGGNSSHYGKKVKAYIQNHQLEQYVKICGKTQNVNDVYLHSSILAIPSISEGFPLAVGEAMAVGLPVIGLKACGGVNSLVKNNITGYLTDNTLSDYILALRKLMSDTKLRQKLGQQGYKDIQQYAPNTIWNKWEQLMLSIVNN